jgi:hypothetical protein
VEGQKILHEVLMCDYSLMEFPNRLAVEGEMLVVHRFRSGSLGLAAPQDCGLAGKKTASRSFWTRVKDFLLLPEEPVTPAVCIPPGARLMLHNVPGALQKRCGVEALEEVRFIQTSATENRHRDAVCFRTGHTIRLQELTVGQHVQVIDLGNCAEEEPGTSENWESIPFETTARRG